MQTELSDEVDQAGVADTALFRSQDGGESTRRKRTSFVGDCRDPNEVGEPFPECNSVEGFSAFGPTCVRKETDQLLTGDGGQLIRHRFTPMPLPTPGEPRSTSRNRRGQFAESQWGRRRYTA